MISLLLTWFTCSQDKIEVLKEANCNGNSSWDDKRTADAAITDGLNSSNLISVTKTRFINLGLSLLFIRTTETIKLMRAYHYELWRQYL